MDGKEERKGLEDEMHFWRISCKKNCRTDWYGSEKLYIFIIYVDIRKNT